MAERAPSRGGKPSGVSPIDALMERASLALEATRYFECETLCVKALGRAHASGDYERMARIVLPLLESRRQKRQLAVDASFLGSSARGVRVIESKKALRAADEPGCYLIQPPLVGADARALRDALDEAQVPAFILAREPLARDGAWPVVAVGAVVLRAKVKPVEGVARVEDRVTKDGFTPDDASRITRVWFESAGEAIGDAALAKLHRGDPPAWLVEDLLEMVDALPGHEKLHQALESMCRRAMSEPPPALPRRRGVADDPFSF